MGSLTTFEKNAILDGFDGFWFALFTDATGDDGSGTELAGGDYARQPIALDPAAAGTTQNTSPVTFTNLPGADPVTDGAIFDDDTAGNMILHKPFPSPIELIEGQDLTFDSGDIVLTAD